MISTVRGRSCVADYKGCGTFITELPSSGWSAKLQRYAFFDELFMYVTKGEVRPRNTAIRIWKRTK